MPGVVDLGLDHSLLTACKQCITPAMGELGAMEQKEHPGPGSAVLLLLH